MKKSIILASLTLLMVGCQTPTPNSGDPTQPEKPNLGFEIGDLSNEIRPQDDFWGYVNAKWIETTEIPADRSSYGTFWQIIDRTEAQIRTILDEVTTSAASADQQTIANLYNSFLDQDALDALGLEPLQDELSSIDAIDSYASLYTKFGEFAALGINSPVTFYADNDATDQTRLILYLWQSGLGLPNRDYYLEDVEKLLQARADYQTHITNLFALAGWDNGDQAATDIVSLETELAKAHWTQTRSRERSKTYRNQYTYADAETFTEKFDLGVWLTALGAGTPDKLVLAQTSYFENVGHIVQATSLGVWKNYLKLHLLKSFAPYLSREIDDENFDFLGRKLRGQQAQAERWKRGVRFINRNAGELLGKIYVERYFPESAKGQIGELVENLRGAFDVSIRELRWMSPVTKTQALNKLQAFLPKLGYPDEWRDYAGLNTSDSLFNNVLNARRFNHQFGLAKLSKPVDRAAWTTNPQTVNAFYRPTHNSITFPAGILQRPMFESGSDPAMNYGAIGSIIGHEFSHGFDDQGRKFDGNGLLRNWWTDVDSEQYQARAQILVDQFEQFQPLPNTSINGQLTLGENIGDLAGATMSYRAFELSGHADGPDVAGLSPRQRFFIAYAIAFRSKLREPYLRELLLRDSHSPGQYRVLGVLRNMTEFYEAFDVQPSDGMYLPEQMRVKIW
ncbi:MAG: M13 family metallopeptidase [Pseudomonadota bacterium]